MNFRLPFDRPMPGILYNLDIFEKALVEAHFQSKEQAPKWLESLGCEAPVEFPRKMTEEFPDLDLTLVGMPDAVFSNCDGNLVLVDYKTARYKGDEDPFMPTYETQLLGYAHLLKSNGVGTVESAALVYFQNQAKEHGESSLKLLSAEGFKMPFEVKIHMVELDMSDLMPLLKQIREYADKRHPPAGLDKCKDCARLQALFDMEELRLNAAKNVRSIDENYYRKIMKPMLMEDTARARAAWSDMDDDLESDRIAGALQDSVPASWDL
jgi:hypothetical protein